jgi:hypothetical protein
MKAKKRARNEERAASRETVDKAVRRGDGAQQGVTNRPLIEERRQQEKLGPRGNDQADDEAVAMAETQGTSAGQNSAGKTGLRSGSLKRATANRGGIAPGKARA